MGARQDRQGQRSEVGSLLRLRANCSQRFAHAVDHNARPAAPAKVPCNLVGRQLACAGWLLPVLNFQEVGRTSKPDKQIRNPIANCRKALDCGPDFSQCSHDFGLIPVCLCGASHFASFVAFRWSIATPGDWGRSLSPPDTASSVCTGPSAQGGRFIGIAALAVSRISNACVDTSTKFHTLRVVLPERSPILVSHRVACIASSTGEQHLWKRKKPIWFLVPTWWRVAHCWAGNQGRMGLDSVVIATTLDGVDYTASEAGFQWSENKSNTGDTGTQ